MDIYTLCTACDGTGTRTSGGEPAGTCPSCEGSGKASVNFKIDTTSIDEQLADIFDKLNDIKEKVDEIKELLS